MNRSRRALVLSAGKCSSFRSHLTCRHWSDNSSPCRQQVSSAATISAHRVGTGLGQQTLFFASFQATMAGCFLQHAGRRDGADLERGAFDIPLQDRPVEHRPEQPQTAVNRDDATPEPLTRGQDDVPVGVEVSGGDRRRRPGAEREWSSVRSWNHRPAQAVHPVLLLLHGRLPMDLHVPLEIQTPEFLKREGLWRRRWHRLAEGAVAHVRANAISDGQRVRLRIQMTTGMSVETEPIVCPCMLEVEMPPMVALGPQTARTAADLAESVVVMVFHLVPPFPPSQHRRHRSRPC